MALSVHGSWFTVHGLGLWLLAALLLAGLAGSAGAQQSGVPKLPPLPSVSTPPGDFLPAIAPPVENQILEPPAGPALPMVPPVQPIAPPVENKVGDLPFIPALPAVQPVPPVAPPIENKAVEPQPVPVLPNPQPLQPKNDENGPTAVFPHTNDFTQVQLVMRREREELEFPVDLPGWGKLFRRQSDSQFQERIRQEIKRQGGGKVMFPEAPVLSREELKPRQFEPGVAMVQPSYIVHNRLLFEQPNFERYGWDLGLLTPVANAGVYYYDLAMLPYHMWTRPLEQMDTSAGKYLPGDPVPLLLYPETFSVTGLAGMAGTFVAGPFLFH